MKILPVAIVIYFFCAFNAASQTEVNDKLIKYPQLEIHHLDNPFFKEYFEVYIEQPVNHDDPKSQKFKQRFCIGYNGLDFPNVMDLDGYNIDYAARPGYINELGNLLKCNLVTVEHRYFGKSVPAIPDWKFLTIKQAANDIHAIKLVLDQVMKGKWLATGASKGGQTALAYRMYYPTDVEGVMIFGTPVRKEEHDKRLDDFFTAYGKTTCGKAILDYQKGLLQQKKQMLLLFQNYAKDKKIKFTGKDIETVYEYMVLSFPFYFTQKCGECYDVPIDSTNHKAYLRGLLNTVPPKSLADETKQRSEASYYMLHSELGNYEYDITPFKGLLKEKEYSNQIFFPANATVRFNKTYLNDLNKFISKEASRLIFIYGANDPWASLQPDLSKAKESKIYLVKDICHKVKLSELTSEQRKEIYTSIETWLGCKFPLEK